LFSIALAWPSKQSGYAAIGKVFACAVPDSTGGCPPGAAAAPAAGVLQAGDVVVSVDGHDVRTTPAVLYGPGNPPQGTPVKGGSDGLVALVRAAPPGPITLGVKRDGAVRMVTITPVIGSEHQPRLGIGPREQFVRVGPLAAAGTAADQFGKIFTGSFGALGKIPHEIGNIFKSKTPARTINDQGASVTSVVGVARIAGEGFSSDGISGGSAFVLSLIAAVNIFVGIFNLFPFLPLDGGHVAILGYEKMRNAWRRRRHLAVAGPVDLTKLMPLTYGVLVIIVAVSALIMFADISNPVANPFQ
jgi:membrane-associated protease RseP (regulator of RpoE activity)